MGVEPPPLFLFVNQKMLKHLKCHPINHIVSSHRPFDPQYYEDEFEDEEMLDEEGRTRLKLKVCRD